MTPLLLLPHGLNVTECMKGPCGVLTAAAAAAAAAAVAVLTL